MVVINNVANTDSGGFRCKEREAALHWLGAFYNKAKIMHKSALFLHKRLFLIYSEGA